MSLFRRIFAFKKKKVIVIDMDSVKLNKKDYASGMVNLPGSKSLSNRALLLSALARGKTRIFTIFGNNIVFVWNKKVDSELANYHIIRKDMENIFARANLIKRDEKEEK